MNEAFPDYRELPLDRFLDLLSSGEPAPGGGAAAAVAVALAAALAGMAARLAAKHLPDAAELTQKAEELRTAATPLARADAAAYADVIAAQRKGANVREALSEAAEVPLTVAGTGAEVAGLAARLAEDGNPNLKGDAVAAVLLAEAGARAAATLVEINLAGDEQDERLARVRELVGAATEARRAVGST
jgi:formiminotetrahydrofolate cyclodeaminase